MKKILTAALVSLAILLIACSSDQIHDAKVIGKKHIPARATIMTMVVGNNIVPYTTYFPEQYILKVEGIDDAGEKVAVSVPVTESDYYEFEVGDRWEPEGQKDA